MEWEDIAQTLLDAASAPVSVGRKVIAPGPDFARDCRMVAVHLEQPLTRPVAGDLGKISCATVPVLVWRVTFVADCVPGPKDDGGPPAPQDITDWSKTFLADSQAIYDALADVCGSGDIGDCKTVTLGDGTPTGPSGGIATMSWPVTVRDMA